MSRCTADLAAGAAGQPQLVLSPVPAPPGTHLIKLAVDPDRIVPESDETDNATTLPVIVRR